MREPETIKELREEIVTQLKKSETVTITLTEGDGIHELIESLDHAIKVCNMTAGCSYGVIHHAISREKGFKV